MANHDPIQDLELLADEKFLTLEGDFLNNFAQWDPVYEGQRVQADEAKYYNSEQMPPMAYSNSSSVSPANVSPNHPSMPDYLASTENQQVYFHPGVSHSSNGSDVPPSVASYLPNDDDPSSVRPPKSRDRARHREVEQKYRNRINSKMDELCTLLTPDGKPQMQKWTALDNAIKLIKYLRRQNEFLRNESANLRAQVYTLQCALNRSMGVDFVPNTSYPPEQAWPSNSNSMKMAGSLCSVSPGPSPSSASDDIPIQKARLPTVPGPSPPAYSPLSPSSYSDSSNGGGNGMHRVSPNMMAAQHQAMPPTQMSLQQSMKPVVTLKKVNLYRPAPTATTAAIPQGRTLLACVLFSVLFFWNPFIAVSQNSEEAVIGHRGHDHGLERVYDYGDSAPSYGTGYQWLSSTYIIAGLIHLLLFMWLVARLFVLPEEMLANGTETETDIEAEVKQHVRYAHDHIANGHYSVAFEELSTACAIMGHPLPQTNLDVVLSFIWALFRQFGHIFRFGIAITVWTVQFLADGPLQPAVLHRRLTTCASIQQRIVKLAAAGKIDLPVCTRLALSLSSISLQETAYALATSGCSDRHWHHLLEDSYITTSIFIFHLPLPVCFLARYYLLQAAATAKLFGSVGEHRRFGWLYNLDLSTVKDLVSMSIQTESAQDKTSQSVFFDNTLGGKRSFAINEPWSRLAWLRSRDLLTDLLSCLTLSAPATQQTSIPKAMRSRTIDSTIEYCLGELEQIENCLRGGTSSTSRLGNWLKLLRGCHAWRRADHDVLMAIVDSMMKNGEIENDADSANPTHNALQFALVSASLLPNATSRYLTIQRLLRASSALLESNLHEDPDDIVLQFCRLMAAEITLSCRLYLVGHNAGDKKNDLSHAESCMTVYLVLLDRMSPNHPRALIYRSRVALAAGENPIVAERFAKAALAVTVDSSQSRGVRFATPNQSTINLLSAEAVLLLSLIHSKFTAKLGTESNSRERDALLLAVQSFQDENSPALAHLCNQLIGVD